MAEKVIGRIAIAEAAPNLANEKFMLFVPPEYGWSIYYKNVQNVTCQTYCAESAPPMIQVSYKQRPLLSSPSPLN